MSSLKKLIYLVCSALFTGGGLLFLVLRLKPLEMKQVMVIYSSLVHTERGQILSVVACALLLLLGLGFMLRGALNTGSLKTIIMKKDGETLRIPVEAIQNLAEQLLESYSVLDDYRIRVAMKGAWIQVDVQLAFSQAVSVSQETDRIRRDMKETLEHSLQISQIKVDFEIRGVKARRPARLSEPEIDTPAQPDEAEAVTAASAY